MSQQWACRGSKPSRALLSSPFVQRLWTPRHAARGWPATLAVLTAFAVHCLWVAPAHAESFVRRLAERALERGIAQEARGDIAQALTSYDEAVRADATLGSALMRLAALRQRLGDRLEAERLYTRATTALGSEADAYFARALLREGDRRRKEATADLERAVELTGGTELRRLLGTWYAESRSWPAALAVWRALLVEAQTRGNDSQIHEARLTVAALTLLSGDSDPVMAGASSTDWARRSLARVAKRSAAADQGARKLTP